MPQNPVLVYSKEDGTPSYMHTVDASEAIRLGDYTAVAPGEVPPEARASAMSRFVTGQGVTHPELQTDEEKAAARQKANEEAAVFAGLPPGTPVVVQAPSERPASRAAREAASHAPAPSAPPATEAGAHHEATSEGATRPRRP
jgi:hypothetical protein